MPALHIIESGGAQNLFGHFYIVEWIRTFARDLHLLMAFAGQQDDVSGTRFADGERDGFAPVGFDSILGASFLQADQGIVNDGAGIFTPRIIRGEHDEITATPGGLAHQGTLGAIAIAAATEQRNDSRSGAGARNKFTSERGQIAECIVGVGVIHDYSEGLATVDALKSAWDMGQRGNTA